ncbi:hypothetical protein RGN32_001322 [Providencia stuartii]
MSKFKFSKRSEENLRGVYLTGLIKLRQLHTEMAFRPILKHRRKSLNIARYSKKSLFVILLCPSLLLTGCTSTQTSYVPAQCTPIPATLTEPVLAPLPPDSDGKTLSYSQIILWIPSLLATIDKANQQLNAIREIEAVRSHN